MARFYDAGNPNCSPYEPAMGHTVIYRTARQGREHSEKFPGIITSAIKDDVLDRVDLIVFTPTGPRHVMRVKFSSDDTTENTWNWLPDLVERKVAKPVAKSVEAIANT